MPLMVSGFIQSIVLLTDSAFLSRYSTLSFDAVGNAGLLFITCYMILVGLGDGTQIILARRIGEKNTRKIPHVFSSALVLQFVFAALLFLALFFYAPKWLISISHDQTIGTLQGDFLSVRAFAFFPSLLFSQRENVARFVFCSINSFIQYCFGLFIDFWKLRIT